MKSLSDSMDFLGIGTRFFGNKSSSSSTTEATTTQRADLEPGLKGLTAPSNLNRSCINRTTLVPSSSSNSLSSAMDGRIVDKKNNREFPPPIPLLARTGNLPCHMPWVLKRCYVNGRLVLHEVPVKHHEFFKADRSNGRLVLRIMYMADKDSAANVDNDENAVDQALVLSTSSLCDQEHVEENEEKSDHGAEENVFPPMSPVLSLTDEKYVEESDDVKSEAESDSQCIEEKGLEMKQEEELKALPMLAKQQDHPQHRVMQRVWTESRICSSSMPCSPKDCMNDFFRIGTPTIRPIYS